MVRQSKPSDAQKLEVVLLLLWRAEPAAVLARRYGVSDATLYRWRDEFMAAGKSALSDKHRVRNGSSQRVVELDRELGERNQVINEPTVANRILEKVSGASN